MNKRTKTMLLGLVLVALVFSAYVVIEPAQGIIPLLIFIGVLALASFIGGYLVATYTMSTTYELGENQTMYLNNTLNEFQADKLNLDNMGKNSQQLSQGQKYIWYRQAEQAVLNHLNETTFQYSAIYDESSVQSGYINASNGITDSLSALAGHMNSFTVDTLPAFANIDIKFDNFNMFVSGDASSSVKGLSAYNFCLEVSKSPSPQLAAGIPYTYGYLLAGTSSSGTPDIGITGYQTVNGSVTVTFTPVDLDTGALTGDSQTASATFDNTYSTLKYVDAPILSAGTVYQVNVTSTQQTGTEGVHILLSGDLVPFNTTNTENMIYTDCVGIDQSVGHSAVGEIPLLRNYRGYSETGQQFFTLSMKQHPDVTNYINQLSTYQHDAMSDALIYWTTLRAQGFRSASDVPSDQLVLGWSNLVPATNTTDNLSTDQMMALYLAMLRNTANWINSTNYQTVANMTVSQPIGDLSFYANVTAYTANGTNTYFVNMPAFFMPQLHNLILIKGENTTLSESLQTIYNNQSDPTVSATWNMLTLPSGSIIGTHNIWNRLTNGTVIEVNNATLKPYTLQQLSSLWDFTIQGAPTYATIQANSFVTLAIIAIAVVAVIVLASTFTGGSGRRSYRRRY